MYAEKGGDEELKERLRIRNVESLSVVPVHSDPDHKLLLQLKSIPGTEAPIYVHKLKKMTGEDYMDSRTSIPWEDYNMVQPAVIVAHRSGSIKQIWSWRTGILADVEPKVEGTTVPGYGMLVSIRPKAADIVRAVKQGGPIQVQGLPVHQMIREKMREPAFALRAGAAAVVLFSAAGFCVHKLWQWYA